MLIQEVHLIDDNWVGINMKKIIAVISLVSSVANATDLAIDPIHLKPSVKSWLEIKKETCDMFDAKLTDKIKSGFAPTPVEFEEYNSCYSEVTFKYKIDYSKIAKLSMIRRVEATYNLPTDYLHDLLEVGDDSFTSLLVEPTDPEKLLQYKNSLESIAITLKQSIDKFGQSATIIRFHLGLFYPSFSIDNIISPLSYDLVQTLPESTQKVYEKFKIDRPTTTIDKTQTHRSNLKQNENCSVMATITNKNPYTIQSTSFMLSGTNKGRSTVLFTEKFEDDTIVKPNQTVKICFNLSYMNTNLMPDYDITTNTPSFKFKEDRWTIE